MKTTVEMVLRQNLKALKLSTMFSCLEEHSRQASQTHQSYEEFLLGLTDIELQVRSQNRLKRRLKDAKFPLMKTLDTFECIHNSHHLQQLLNFPMYHHILMVLLFQY